MEARAVILEHPKRITLGHVPISPPADEDVVVKVHHSGISTGTEKLLWSGDMPDFPGMGYPLIPGYEASGEVVEAGPASGFFVGDTVFVPGARCYGDIRGLFGGASDLLVTPADRIVRTDPSLKAQGALLALAATALHAVTQKPDALPELIVGHGVVGRLLARCTIALGGQPPVVWETDPARRHGAQGYVVYDPEEDDRRDYARIVDATGDASLIDSLIGRLCKGGELVLAGFYADRPSFAFPMAFIKEVSLRVAAEWTRDDLITTRNLINNGALDLSGLITHRRSAERAADAYQTAFSDPTCLKMIIDWEHEA